jgi:hypothetical protein
MEQEHGYGLADDVAAAYDNRMLTADGKAASLKDFDYACRGAGRQSWAARLQATSVHRMKTIYILFGRDCVK